MNSRPPANRDGQRYRKSWTAYVAPTLVLLVFVGIGIGLAHFSDWLGGAFIVFWTALFLWGVFENRAVVLYTDEHGVWVRSGLLPWSKGTTGVKWRDIEDAVYCTGFRSWLFKSYTVRIGHRFTKSSEIVLTHIAHGNDAVAYINGYLQQAVANGSAGITA